MLKAILLDLDETLCATNSASKSAMRSIVELISTDSSERAAILDLWSRNRNEMWEDAERAQWAQTNPVEARGVNLRAALRGCGLDPNRAPPDSCYRMLRSGHLTLLPGAHRLLANARSAGIPLAIVTNGTASEQTEKLEHLGILGAIDAVVVSEVVGASKPSAVPFLRALSLLDVEPQEAVFIGDDLSTDGAGATAIGMPFVHRGDGQCSASPRICTLDILSLESVSVSDLSRVLSMRGEPPCAE